MSATCLTSARARAAGIGNGPGQVVAGPARARPPACSGRRGWAQSIAVEVWKGPPSGVNLNARETGRDTPPALGRTADAVPKGYFDWVHQARVFPGPPGSRPARSVFYTHRGETYKATIGRPRRRYSRRAGFAAATAGHAEAEESGSAVIAIVVTDRQVEVWSAEPAQGWANPSLVPHDEITNIQYLQ